jgi:hypothetical protein
MCVSACMWCSGVAFTRPACDSPKELFTLLDLCVSSLRRGHANLLCIVPILTDDPRRESELPLRIRIRIVHAQHLHTNQNPQRRCNLMARAPHSQLHAAKRKRNGSICRSPAWSNGQGAPFWINRGKCGFNPRRGYGWASVCAPPAWSNG